MNVRIRLSALLGSALLGLLPTVWAQPAGAPETPAWTDSGSRRAPSSTPAAPATGIDWNRAGGGSRAPSSLAPAAPAWNPGTAAPSPMPRPMLPQASPPGDPRSPPRGHRPALDGGAAKVVGRSASIELARGEQQLVDVVRLTAPAFDRDNAALRQRYGGLHDGDDASDVPADALRAGGPAEPLATAGGDRFRDASPAARLSSAGLGQRLATSRGGDVSRVQAGSQIQATALLCSRNGGQPLLRRLTVAGDGALAPKAAFVIQGQCFGTAPGTVKVILPTAYGPIRSVDAQVVDWQAGKIFAVLPDVDRVIPGAATVDVIASGGARGSSAPLAFEPAWELRQRSIPATTGRIDSCAGGGYFSRCVLVFAGHEIDHRDPQFELAATCRASGLPGILDPLGLSNAFVSCKGQQRALGEGLQGQVLAQHNSGGDGLRDTLSRSDVYQLQLPPYARLAALRYQSRSFPGRGRIEAPRFDPASGQLEVAWSMIRDGGAEPGLIEYAIDFDTLWPRGVDR